MGAHAEADVLKVATPLALSVPVPSGVWPSRNVTGPVGVLVPDAVTVTAWRKVDGLDARGQRRRRGLAPGQVSALHDKVGICRDDHQIIRDALVRSGDVVESARDQDRGRALKLIEASEDIL